jgi:hypothetical protein
MLLRTLVLAVFYYWCEARYFITNPLGNVTWQVNQPAYMTWIIKPEGPTANKLTVDLIAGADANSSKWVANICDNLPPTATSCSWATVPAYLPTLPSGYSIRIDYNLEPPEYDYSPKFQIIGLKTGSDQNLPRQPPPEACIVNCTGDIVDPNPGLNANPPYNRKNDPRFNTAMNLMPSSSSYLVMSILIGLCFTLYL